MGDYLPQFSGWKFQQIFELPPPRKSFNIQFPQISWFPLIHHHHLVSLNKGRLYPTREGGEKTGYVWLTVQGPRSSSFEASKFALGEDDEKTATAGGGFRWFFFG